MLTTEIYKNREPTNNREGYLSLNPEKSEILKMISGAKKKGGKVLMEIGFGDVGGISLEKNDLYIGVEPYFEGIISFRVNQAERGANVIVVNGCEKLPDFTPDLVLCLAPNPNDIDEGMLYQYERFINDPKTAVVVVTDNRTREATSGAGAQALKNKVICDLRDMGRRNVGSSKVTGGISSMLDEVLEIERSSSFQASRNLVEEANVVWSEAR